MTTATQLEIAAHWLREAALHCRFDHMRENLIRVADECERMAKREAA